jgi:leucyl aminopeptidase
MAGSAVALGTFKFLVENNYSNNLICAIWLVENLVSSKSYTPTDIIKMYNWKTVRVFNTDAEWRLVLADTLSYVEKNYKIEKIFDFATLTWAAIIALWNEIIAIMGKNASLTHKIQKIWWQIKERAWELPLYEKYKELLKTPFADISNCIKSRGAGTITAWLFLSEFVKTKNWVHFDIAWPDILENHPIYQTGGSWIGIRLAIKLFQE